MLNIKICRDEVMTDMQNEAFSVGGLYERGRKMFRELLICLVVIHLNLGVLTVEM
jgi:hypothetical protein